MPVPSNVPVLPSPGRRERLPALDWLRGLVMAIMAVDHVDAVVNPHHAQGDSAGWSQPFPLSPPDFLTRWASHLCAPTFVLLAGAGIALSSASTRQLVLRGLVLIALELTLVSSYWRSEMGGGWSLLTLPVFLQVVWALGFGMVALAFLRRLPAWLLLLLAIALLLLPEFVLRPRSSSQPLWFLALLNGGFWGGDRAGGRFFDVMVLYPALPWLPGMLLGFLGGRSLGNGRLAARTVLLAGVAALGLFAVVRGLDGFGTLGLHRRGPGILEWLHTSKYPPSIAFLALELGLACILLAGLLAWQRRGAAVWRWNPLLVLGQVPMFYYLLHLPMIGLCLQLGWLPMHTGSWCTSWWGALLVVAMCLPFCAAYRWYKQTWQHGWTRCL